MTIQQKIRTWRKALKLTQAQAAKRVGMTQGAWASIEVGKRDNLTLASLRRVAKALRRAVRDFV